MNLFVDTLIYTPNFAPYDRRVVYSGITKLQDYAVRGSGPAWTLPTGDLVLTFGLQERIAKSPRLTFATVFQAPSTASTRTTYFERKSVTDSGYLEALVPLLPKKQIPFFAALDLQLAGRVERFGVDTGTPSGVTALSTGVTTYSSPTQNGQPFFSRAHYQSENETIAIRYQPHPDVTIRLSRANAFLPPTPAQLVRNPLPDTSFSNITDPRNGNGLFAVQTYSGGNPNLQPQTSKSENVGVIWEPRAPMLSGLRVNVEYYSIDQFNAIGSLSPQQLITAEAIYGDRITRNAAGMVTLIDRSSVNIFKRESSGWDFSLAYSRETPWGRFELHFGESIIDHLVTQTSVTLPASDAVDFPSEGGAAKYKSNASFNWSRGNLRAGWVTNYTGSYTQFGAPNGPLVASGNSDFSGYIPAQGSSTIPSQSYHDAFVGYSFGALASRGGRVKHGWRTALFGGTTLQIGIKNVFNALPPVDAFYPYYVSPYGDMRLRSYWINLRKEF